MKLLRMLRLVFSPFKSIAISLKKIADLYEEELSERQPAIRLRTEKPNPRLDTEVMNPWDTEKPEWRRWLDPDRREKEEEYDDE